jgi:hypothetical protein
VNADFVVVTNHWVAVRGDWFCDSWTREPDESSATSSGAALALRSGAQKWAERQRPSTLRQSFGSGAVALACTVRREGKDHPDSANLRRNDGHSLRPAGGTPRLAARCRVAWHSF